MITPTHSQPKMTPLQCEYLNALRDGKKTGKQMRGRLRRRGVRGSNGAFYRVMQRLKWYDLIKSRRVPKKQRKYRRQEYYYELTDAGWKQAGPKLELLQGGENTATEQQCREQIERARACLG